MNIIITGPKGSGKSTALSKILSSLSVSKSGFITEFSDRGSRDRKLRIRSIDGCVFRTAAHWCDGEVNVDMSAFDDFASALIDLRSDVIIIDELGKFEKRSEKLKEAVSAAFDSDTDVIASIRLDADGWMQALKYRDDVIIFTVNGISRNDIPAKVLELLNG